MNTMREDFEAWALSTGFDVLEISRLSDDQYYSLNVQVGWQAWQAARQPVGEAVAWQINATKSGRGWEACTRECYEDTLRTGCYMGLPAGTRDVQVRQLYTAPPAQQSKRVDLEQFRQAVLDQFDLARQEETWSRHSRIKMQAAEAERDRLLAIIDSQESKP